MSDRQPRTEAGQELMEFLVSIEPPVLSAESLDRIERRIQIIEDEVGPICGEKHPVSTRFCYRQPGHAGRHTTKDGDVEWGREDEASRGPDLAVNDTDSPGTVLHIRKGENVALCGALVSDVCPDCALQAGATEPRCDDPDCSESDPRHEHGWGLAATPDVEPAALREGRIAFKRAELERVADLQEAALRRGSEPPVCDPPTTHRYDITPDDPDRLICRRCGYERPVVLSRAATSDVEPSPDLDTEEKRIDLVTVVGSLWDDAVAFVRWSADVRDDNADAIAIARDLAARLHERKP